MYIKKLNLMYEEYSQDTEAVNEIMKAMDSIMNYFTTIGKASMTFSDVEAIDIEYSNKKCVNSMKTINNYCSILGIEEMFDLSVDEMIDVQAKKCALALYNNRKN